MHTQVFDQITIVWIHFVCNNCFSFTRHFSCLFRILCKFLDLLSLLPFTPTFPSHCSTYVHTHVVQFIPHRNVPQCARMLMYVLHSTCVPSPFPQKAFPTLKGDQKEERVSERVGTLFPSSFSLTHMTIACSTSVHAVSPVTCPISFYSLSEDMM